jgi:hypothetical protein
MSKVYTRQPITHTGKATSAGKVIFKKIVVSQT